MFTIIVLCVGAYLIQLVGVVGSIIGTDSCMGRIRTRKQFWLWLIPYSWIFLLGKALFDELRRAYGTLQ